MGLRYDLKMTVTYCIFLQQLNQANAGFIQEEDEEMVMEWERWARAQLSADWQRRISITLQRGNARVLRSGVLRARSGVGVRVYGRMGGCTFSLDVGSGD